MLVPTRTPGKPVAARRHRRAYILLVVLAFTALASALGMSFLEANSTVMPEAVNYKGMVRAEALASSGIGMASHFLLYPPTTLSLTQYYTGANAVTLDSSGDYFDVSVLRSDAWSPAQTDLNLYRITAMGVAKDPGGAVRAKRTATAEIQAPPIGKWQFTQAFVSSAAALYVPSQATITGDVHANGNISGNGSCNGKVSATGAAVWAGGGPPTSVTSLAPNIARPLRTPYQAGTYTIRGKTYSAYTSYNNSEIKQSDADALNAIDMSATNPGRLIFAKDGKCKLRVNVNLNGTLVVNDDLEIDDAGNHQVTAVQGFPALIVSGDIKFLNDGGTATINGSIICAGQLDSNSKDNVNLTVNGTFFADSGMDVPRSTCTYQFNWSATRSVFWDIQNVPPLPQPMTILNWTEN